VVSCRLNMSLAVQLRYACPRCFQPFAKYTACDAHVDQCMEMGGKWLAPELRQQIYVEARQLPLRPASEVVHIEARRMNGEEFEADVCSATTVIELKERIENVWRVPAIAQKLIRTADVPTQWSMPPLILNDNEQLSLHSQTGSGSLVVHVAFMNLKTIIGMWRPEQRFRWCGAQSEQVSNFEISELAGKLFYEQRYDLERRWNSKDPDLFPIHIVSGELVENADEWLTASLVESQGVSVGTIRLQFEDASSGIISACIRSIDGHEMNHVKARRCAD